VKGYVGNLCFIYTYIHISRGKEKKNKERTANVGKFFTWELYIQENLMSLCGSFDHTSEI
jgi:hypothetical protein